ncbi:hypothetical protein KO566_01600 [Flavobacteriaceae bacterium XHP0103]|uniref:GDSL-type esterase/lipase family protein n=1 Tax=Marixanthotalea marina TaxID=2844359 RepID=UPI002989AA78|nr:GDSL-type esterase/lipase family protein [Marixanthotalea marina]MBU3820741.1 hypothetical protein [Marixanthotalea marina]
MLFIFCLPVFGQNLTITAPNGSEFWQVGKTPSITWDSSGLTANIVLEYSTNNGSTWNIITTVSNATNSYEWTIPDAVSTQCLVRATSNATTDISDAVFEISDDASTCKIVVLGSSTAYGNGATSSEYAWVNLYASAIFQKNTKLEVVNLSYPGYNTFQILPTGSTVPGGETIDTNKNITKAIVDYSPVAIIINMPSNDTADGYSTSTQMENFATLNTYATNNSVPLWIATTQPRNSFDASQIQTQIDVKDAIISTYGNNAINFWEDIADTDGKILSSLDSGDGIHVNNDGHAILFNKVLDKNIDELTCSGGSLSLDETLNSYNSLKVYPNPAHDYVLIDFNSEFSGDLKVEFFNVLGRKLFEKNTAFNTGFNSIFTLTKGQKNLKSQFIFGKLTFKTDNQTVQKSIKLIVQ